jgi:hypothetical protein
MVGEVLSLTEDSLSFRQSPDLRPHLLRQEIKAIFPVECKQQDIWRRLLSYWGGQRPTLLPFPTGPPSP